MKLSQKEINALRFWEEGPGEFDYPHHKTNHSLYLKGLIEWDYDGYVPTEEGQEWLDNNREVPDEP